MPVQNDRWDSLTPGELQVAVDALGRYIKQLHAEGGSPEELIALGVVHSALHIEYRLRKQAVINKVTVKAGTHRRRRGIR